MSKLKLDLVTSTMAGIPRNTCTLYQNKIIETLKINKTQNECKNQPFIGISFYSKDKEKKPQNRVLFYLAVATNSRVTLRY